MRTFRHVILCRAQCCLRPFCLQSSKRRYRLSVQQDGIIVRRYVSKDYSDIFKAGYPFGSDLTPDMQHRVRNLLNREEIKKALFRRVLPLHKEEISLVAHSPKNGKTVGVVTCRRITDNLWGIWHAFVSPSSRGKGIASILYQKSFELLKKKNVKKVAGMVLSDNVASLRSIQKSWEGYLPTRIFICKGRTQIHKEKLAKLAVGELQEDRKRLFETFQDCVGEQWCSFLEFNEDNFAGRLFGPGLIEPVEKRFLTTLAIKENVVLAEYEGRLAAYAIYRTDRFSGAYRYLHLFVPLSDHFLDVCLALLSKVPTGSTRIVSIGNPRVRDCLKRLGFEVREGLVPYRHL